MPETIETVTCPYCKNKIPVKEYLDTHYATCPKRLAHPLSKKVKTPLKIVTNEEETPEEFLSRIDEWEKKEIPRRDSEPAAAAPLIPVNPEEGKEPEEVPVEEPEDRTFLIRDRVLVESNGKVEEPSETVKELPEKEVMEESSEELPIEEAGE